MRIYGDYRSGNCYKIQLLLSHLNLSCDWVELDILAGDTRTAEYRAKNPNGKIPLLELDDGRLLAESNAILNFLAADSPLLPADPWARAQVLSWQFFEQYSHEPAVAVARFIMLYQDSPPARAAELRRCQERAKTALAVMEQHLRDRQWFVGEAVSIADISLYAYTHVADEGGIELQPYPAITAWLARVAAQAGHQPMRAC